MVDTPKLYKIKDIKRENKLVKTYWLEILNKTNIISTPKPGNYVMLWVPEPASKKFSKHVFDIVDQIPMSISDFDHGNIAITVKNVGHTTNELHKYNKGRYVGIIGPKGNSFNLTGKKLLVIGGGIGIAPLRFLVKTLKTRKCKVHFLAGATTSEELILIDEIKKYSDTLHITTDDGSAGVKGLVTDMLQEIYDDKKPDQIFSCGPEKMMKTVLEFSLAHNMPAQFSLERFMHCGIGVCGFCSISDLLVCRDGPIFDSNTLKDVNEFGKVRRKASGILEKI